MKDYLYFKDHPPTHKEGEQNMAVSEAQKKSAQKWDAANLDRISVAIAKGKKDEIKAAAVAAGESMNQYIISAIESRVNGTPLSVAAGAQDTEGAILTPETFKKAQEAAQNAGETVSAFVDRAVETQAQRDKLTLAMRPKEKVPDKPET